MPRSSSTGHAGQQGEEGRTVRKEKVHSHSAGFAACSGGDGRPNTASGSAAPSKVAPAAPQVAANDKDKDKAEKKRDRTASTKELNANDDKQKAEKALRRAARAADAKAAADKEDAERFMTRPDVRPAGECTFYKEQCVSALTPCLFCDICRHTYHHACSAARNNHESGKCPCTIGVSPT